jgi:hypothetical protein
LMVTSDEIATRWAGALIAATVVGELTAYATNAQPLAVAGGALVAVLIGFAPNRSLGPVLLLFGLLYFCAALVMAAILDPLLTLHARAPASLYSLLLLEQRPFVFRACTIATSYALMLTGIVAYVRGVRSGQSAPAPRAATPLTVASESPGHVIVIDPRAETMRFERRRFRHAD